MYSRYELCLPAREGTACERHKQVQGSTLSQRTGCKWWTRLLQTITQALTVRLCSQKHGATAVAKALCAQPPSQLGKKNKWHVLGELGYSTALGPECAEAQLTPTTPPQHPQHPPRVPLQLMQGLQPPSHCPSLSCWGHANSSGEDTAHLHEGKRERRGRGGQAPQGLKPLCLGRAAATHSRDSFCPIRGQN